MGLLDMLLGDPGTGAARAKEAQALSKQERQFLMSQLGRQTGRIDKGTKQQVALTMGGQSAAANAAREAQKKALENVGKYSGNPMAMGNFLAQSGTNQLLGSIYQQGAGQMSNILGQGLGLHAQAEGLATTGRQNVLQSEQGVLSSIQDSQPGMLGGLLEAYMGMKGLQGSGDTTITVCWVAREVYGESNPKWMMFREWLLTKAPRWFRSLYIRHGERFARFISNKPRAKQTIRRWMDTKVEF